MMKGGPRLFRMQAVLLGAVVTVLALAEQQWIHWWLTAAGVGVGSWGVLTRRPAMLSVRAGHAVVIVAFAVLIVEIGVLGSIPVMALSHFLIVVCISRLLQRQTVRDQGQFLVMCYLLLMVASIVSGNLLFPLVLVVYLTAGVQALIGLQLELEQGRVDGHNRRVGGDVLGSAVLPGSRQAAWSLGAVNVTVLAVGAVLFLFVPRVGTGMMGQIEGRAYAAATTGLASTLSFERVGAIQSSERQVMTVQVADEQGHAVGPASGEPYIRAMVFDQYGRRIPHRGGYWEWRVATPNDAAPRDDVFRADAGTGEIRVIRGLELHAGDYPLVQKYWLQPTEQHYLYACYPAATIHSGQLWEVRKRIVDQTLQVFLPRPMAMRYEVTSPSVVTAHVVNRLAGEREPEDEPAVRLPEPPLPREAEIRRLVASIDNRSGTSGPLDDPGRGQRFVESVISFLQSPQFEYTLEPSPVQRGREPIGDFLLDEHRGRCEYYASALALMCQYRGVPARVVTGYLGGDYNEVGGYYVVRERNAHTWVEVFIAGRDWVRYDPTPADERVRLRHRWWLGIYTYADYMQFQWNNQVLGYDDSVRQALISRFTDWLRRPIGQQTTLTASVLAFIGEMVLWRSELRLQDRLLYYAFTIMVLALVVLLGYAGGLILRGPGASLVRRCRAYLRRGPGPQADFYVRFSRRVEHLGLHRRRDETPAEFADGLARRFPVFEPAPGLVRAYYEVVFGQQSLSAERRAEIESFLRGLRALSRQHLRAVAAGNPVTVGLWAVLWALISL